MALGKKTITYEGLDTEGDKLNSVLRMPTAEEETAFRKSRFLMNSKGRVAKDLSLEARVAFYDLLLVDVHGVWADEKGEKKEFSKNNPPPADLALPLKDYAGVGYKENCIIYLFENGRSFQEDEDDTEDNVVKK